MIGVWRLRKRPVEQLEADVQRLGASGLEGFAGDGEFAEHARIHEAQFPARLQPRHQVSVFGHGRVGWTHREPASHPEMHDKVRDNFIG